MLLNQNQIPELSRNQNLYVWKTPESETHAIKIGRGVRIIKFGIPQTRFRISNTTGIGTKITYNFAVNINSVVPFSEHRKLSSWLDFIH